MGFKTNTKNITSSDLIPEGDYEVVIRNAEEKQSFSGSNTKLNFTLVIRNDVEQSCKNRCLFLEIWKKKQPNPDDASVDGYNYAHLMNLVKSVGKIPDGTEFGSVRELCEALIGECLNVTVSHNTYNGRTSEKIDQLYGLAPTSFPECRHVFRQKPTPQPDSFASQAGPSQTSGILDDSEVILSDGDIPF